jgi:cyclic-di-GMP phosphodiesterase TipF (flagellum assembly factor)
VIDNVMLFRSVQVLRRLEKRSSARGVFCNISLYSLLDPDFFSEFIAFMEQNRELADAMFFEFGQPVIENCGPMEMESLSALAALGFRFLLDQVTNLDVDFQQLHDMGFRHVKIAADLFLHRMAEAGARIHLADMKSYLERFGMQLIVEKIEDERSLASVLDHHVRLGQGYLFSEPRPVRPEIFGDKEDAEAA